MGVVRVHHPGPITGLLSDRPHHHPPTGLTTRSSEQRLAAGVFSESSLASPASVAELEFVRRFAALFRPVGFPVSPPGICVSGRFPRVSPRSLSFSEGGFPVSPRGLALSPQGFPVSPPGFLLSGRGFALPERFSAGSEPAFRVPPPNKALQRTATGGQPFSVLFALRRRCLSLSLSSLGQQALPGVLRGRVRSRCRWHVGSACR